MPKVKGTEPMSLGTWRCPSCKKVCKVTVSKYKVIETLVPLNTPVLTEVETVIITTEVSLG
jgi:hypothetical protein